MLQRFLVACAVALAGCACPMSPQLEFLGQRQIPRGTMLDGTLVGGLSGISYDAADDVYYLVSDDRSAVNPARFYTARVSVSESGVGDITFVATHPWRNRDAHVFAPMDAAARPPQVPPDPEGIAFDSRRQRLYWSSEGERRGDGIRLDPWVRIAGLDGGFLGEFPLPPQLRMSDGDHGPRRNHALEGLSLSPDGRYLYAAMEWPIYEDGTPPDAQHGASVRVTRFDVDAGRADAEYRYPLDAVSAGPGGDNGLSDLLALDDGSFLVIERGFGSHSTARVYRARIDAGSPDMSKVLLADLTTVPGLSPLDNVEGITLGPRLSGGRRSVVMVSDDNFSPAQVTQFLVFAL